MKIFLKKHESNAGHWIYEGYKKAWQYLGYDCYYYNELEQLKDEENFYVMAIDVDIKNDSQLKILKKSIKTFLFVSPNYFIKHWNNHPNWITSCGVECEKINNEKNIIKWTFLEECDFYNKWQQVKTVKLAFDNFSYHYEKDEKYKFDVCYIGGWANNGFDEKKKIMMEHFTKIKNSDLNAGIFINKNITHEQEIKLLSNSIVSLNIHDAYQRELGLDTNERTFKSLGLNGIMVSDKVDQINKISSSIKMSSDPDKYLFLIKEYLKDPYLDDLRQENKKNILKNHTYKNRVIEFLDA